MEDITANNNKNLDFVVTPSAQAKILNPILCQLRLIAKDQIFVRQRITYKILFLQQYLKTVAKLLFPDLTRKFLLLMTHVERVKQIDFNKELRSGKAFFSGGNSRQLNFYIISTLIDDKPDVVLLHVGTNNILGNANDT